METFAPPKVRSRKRNGQWHIDCPYCGKTHFHGMVAGHRVAHCLEPAPLGYEILEPLPSKKREYVPEIVWREIVAEVVRPKLRVEIKELVFFHGKLWIAGYAHDKDTPRVHISAPNHDNFEFTYHLSEREMWAPWIASVAMAMMFGDPWPADVPAPALLWYPVETTFYGWSCKADEEFRRARGQTFLLDLVRYDPGKRPVGQGKCRGMVL